MGRWSPCCWCWSSGTIGYVVLGFGLLDAVYQTVTTVSTVGFREVEPLSPAGQFFTMVLILVGVGAALYAFSVLIETLIEGRLNDSRETPHGTVDRVDARPRHHLRLGPGRPLDRRRRSPRRVGPRGRRDRRERSSTASPHPIVVGDATEDAVLRAAGIERAGALVAAVDGDAANSFITLSARALHPDLFIVARARSQDSEEKLRRAGADRVVNPQSIGGARMAAFVLRPHVAEFLDVVMHERNLEFRLEEVPVTEVADRGAVAARTARCATTPARSCSRSATRTGPSTPTRARHRDPERPGDHRHRHPGRARHAGRVRPR